MPLNHTSKYAELTDMQFLLVGKLTIEFSNIEFLLGTILNRLLITPSFLGRTYTERMNVISLINKIRNAIDIHERRYRYSIVPKDILETILKTLNDIEKTRLIRNKFAHYCWSRSSDQEIFGTAFLGKQARFDKPNEGSIILKNSEINSIYELAYKIVERLNTIIERLPELEENNVLKNKLKYE